MDFRSADGDLLDLTATRLSWQRLDSNRDDRLDGSDAFVEATSEGMCLDLGAATGRSAAGLHVLTLLDNFLLTESNLLLA